MILSTRGRRAAKALANRYGKSFPAGLVPRTRAILAALDAAAHPGDLGLLPGGALETGKGGRHSVRIDARWRIRFVRTARGFADLEIVDDAGAGGA